VSREFRPTCPGCKKPLIQQVSIKSYRCNGCNRTYEAKATLGFKQVTIEVCP
jgi:ribosomal protein L37AE/L43A